MKLIVIVICLLSERFLMHQLAQQRFAWLSDYVNLVVSGAKKKSAAISPWALIALIVLPIALAVFLVLWLIGGLFYGFICLILNLAIFYYCLGPDNVFYPVTGKKSGKAAAKQYYYDANSQVFAPVFWYILLGPVGVIVYRMNSQLQSLAPVKVQAGQINAVLDWVPARLSALLYMLVGNFQSGLAVLARYLVAEPKKNKSLLGEAGCAAAQSANEEAELVAAEALVEHAIILSLVFLALFTLAAWL